MVVTEAMLFDPKYGEPTVTQDELAAAKAKLKALCATATFLIWAWDDAPEDFRAIFSFNGGDEDWLVATAQEPEWLPFWLESLDAGRDPDVYHLDGLTVYVGSHA